MPRQLPEPPGTTLLNAVRFATETFRFLEGIQARFRDGMALRVPGRPPIVVLTNPDLVHDALDRPEEFPRVPAQDAAAMIAEQGLVQSEGDLWRQQRRIMAPAFGGNQVTTYTNTTGQRAHDLAKRWAEGGAREIDLHRELTSTTVRVASEILLGEDIGRERAATFHEWMRVAGKEFEFGIDLVTPEWLPTRTSPEFEDAAEGIRALSQDLIDRRREQLSAGEDDPSDMLSMLLLAEDESGVDFPENQIRDEVATFLIAGHETTALSITYTLCLLSQHPDAFERVRAEAREVLDGGPPRHEHRQELSYATAAYREALRLYPPAWAVFRQTGGEVALDEYRLPEGAAVIMPQWSIHRDSRYFEDPGTYDPERWLDRDPNAVDAYFPFSTGPHACIGRGFALGGAPLVIARLVRDFDIDTAGQALDDLRLTPTLRPRDGVRATVTPVG